MSKQTGGPAFPVEQFNPHSEQGRALDWQSEGMTLRDYFAAKALTTCLGYERADIAIWEPVDFARHAYQVADAMLMERAK